MPLQGLNAGGTRLQLVRPSPPFPIGWPEPEVGETIELAEHEGSVLRPTWSLLTPALCAGAWLVGFAEFTGSFSEGDTLRGLLAFAALVLGVALPISVTAWWRFGAGTAAVLGATVLGGVAWVTVLFAPSESAASALGLACGAAVAAVGIRARERGRAAVVPVASATAAAIVAFAIFRATDGVVAHQLTAATGVVASALTAIVLAVTGTRGGGWAGRWPAAHDVVISAGTLAGALLATVWLARIVGFGPAIYAGPVFLVAGALLFALFDPLAFRSADAYAFWRNNPLASMWADHDVPGVVGATALVAVPVGVLAFISEWLA